MAVSTSDSLKKFNVPPPLVVQGGCRGVVAWLLERRHFVKAMCRPIFSKGKSAGPGMSACATLLPVGPEGTWPMQPVSWGKQGLDIQSVHATGTLRVLPALRRDLSLDGVWEPSVKPSPSQVAVCVEVDLQVRSMRRRFCSPCSTWPSFWGLWRS